LPVQNWNYKAEDASIHHLGPTAQDFYAAFGLGDSDKAISTVDADGISLAAVQGLYEITQEQAEQIDTLQTQNAELEARLSALEAKAGANGAAQQTIPEGIGQSGWLLAGLLLVGLAIVRLSPSRGER